MAEKDAETLAGEAYQVIAEIAGEIDGLWNHSEVRRALDYFSKGWREPGTEILPISVDYTPGEQD